MTPAVCALILALLNGPSEQQFEDLKTAPDAASAAQVEEDIWTSWIEGGGPTIEILMRRGLDAQGIGDLETARDFYDRVIQISPDYAEAYNRRATIFMAEDNLKEALLDLNEALRLEPRHFGAWIGLGVVLESLGARKEALEAFSSALELYPTQPVAEDAVRRLSRSVQGRGI